MKIVDSHFNGSATKIIIQFSRLEANYLDCNFCSELMDQSNGKACKFSWPGSILYG